jgi:hypothetical protein
MGWLIWCKSDSKEEKSLWVMIALSFVSGFFRGDFYKVKK